MRNKGARLWRQFHFLNFAGDERGVVLVVREVLREENDNIARAVDDTCELFPLGLLVNNTPCGLEIILGRNLKTFFS